MILLSPESSYDHVTQEQQKKQKLTLMRSQYWVLQTKTLKCVENMFKNSEGIWT